MSGGYTVTDIANQSLDAIGWPDVLGEIEDGSRHAQVVLRAYRECLKQLLRAAHWDMARKSVPLVLLADATGQTPNVGSIVPNPNFTFEYAYPADCVKARFVPFSPQSNNVQVPSDNIYIPATPFVSVDPNAPQSLNLAASPIWAGRIVPMRFLVATDYNYLPPSNPIPWDTPGISPQGRTVILTNQRNAVLVYTALMLYPSNWDPMFRAAFVAYLAAEIALPVWAKTDRKFGLQMREAQLPIVRDKVVQARLSDGNEGGPPSSDIRVDWMDARFIGGVGDGGGGWGPGYGAAGPGVLGYSFDTLALPSGSVF